MEGSCIRFYKPDWWISAPECMYLVLLPCVGKNTVRGGCNECRVACICVKMSSFLERMCDFSRFSTLIMLSSDRVVRGERHLSRTFRTLTHVWLSSPLCFILLFLLPGLENITPSDAGPNPRLERLRVSCMKIPGFPEQFQGFGAAYYTCELQAPS